LLKATHQAPRNLVKTAAEFTQLTRIEGIGLILAQTLMRETGDISRCNTVGHDASYCRCVQGARYRNGKKKSNTPIKKGNKYWAWALIEAANFASRCNDTVKRY